MTCSEYDKRLYNSLIRDELRDESARCAVVSYFMREVLILMKNSNMSLQDAVYYVNQNFTSDVMDQVKQAVQHLSFVNEDGKIDDNLCS